MISQLERIRTSLTVGECAGMGLYWNRRNGFFIVVDEGENRLRIEDITRETAREMAKIILAPSDFEGLFPGGEER